MTKGTESGASEDPDKRESDAHGPAGRLRPSLAVVVSLVAFLVGVVAIGAGIAIGRDSDVGNLLYEGGLGLGIATAIALVIEIYMQGIDERDRKLERQAQAALKVLDVVSRGFEDTETAKSIRELTRSVERLEASVKRLKPRATTAATQRRTSSKEKPVA